MTLEVTDFSPCAPFLSTRNPGCVVFLSSLTVSTFLLKCDCIWLGPTLNELVTSTEKNWHEKQLEPDLQKLPPRTAMQELSFPRTSITPFYYAPSCDVPFLHQAFRHPTHGTEPRGSPQVSSRRIAVNPSSNLSSIDVLQCVLSARSLSLLGRASSASISRTQSFASSRSGPINTPLGCARHVAEFRLSFFAFFFQKKITSGTFLQNHSNIRLGRIAENTSHLHLLVCPEFDYSRLNGLG
jgi:hypothetical protein